MSVTSHSYNSGLEAVCASEVLYANGEMPVSAVGTSVTKNGREVLFDGYVENGIHDPDADAILSHKVHEEKLQENAQFRAARVPIERYAELYNDMPQNLQAALLKAQNGNGTLVDEADSNFDEIRQSAASFHRVVNADRSKYSPSALATVDRWASYFSL